MSWLSNFIRPKINVLGNQAKDVPDNLWEKCPSCDGMLFHRDLKAAQNVCYHCGHHLRIDVIERLENLFDNGEYKRHAVPKVPADPLKFKDKKKYADRLHDAQKKRERKDAIVVAEGKINGQGAMVAAFDFGFMGGSMGAGVGEVVGTTISADTGGVGVSVDWGAPDDPAGARSSSSEQAAAKNSATSVSKRTRGTAPCDTARPGYAGS
mgnify:CR=1 FL=1